ncbi:hypothetical protein D4R47_04000 [archaeon]|nr:MAG: hypothetical protein D4R47_04000 [archaeon]
MVQVKVALPVEKAALGLVQRNALRAGAVHLADRVIWEVLKRSDNPPGMKRDEWLTIRGLAYSFHRILREASDLWGMSFVVISGGGNRSCIRATAKTSWTWWKRAHANMYFLVYTNGTQIDSEAARALEKDPGYYDGLHSYDKACTEVLDPVWQEEYINGVLKREAPLRLQLGSQSELGDVEANES